MKYMIFLFLINISIQLGACASKECQECRDRYDKKITKIHENLPFGPRYKGEALCAPCYTLAPEMAKRCKQCILNENVMKMANEPWCPIYYARTGAKKALKTLQDQPHPFIRSSSAGKLNV